VENVTQPQTLLSPAAYFSSVIYTASKPEFLDPVKASAEDALNAVKKDQKMDEAYPVVMSAGMTGDPRINEFEKFIAQSGWLILDNQGYNVDFLGAYISELWCQEHFKYSSMEQHIHSEGVVLSGFYFLDTPEGGQMIEVHDPRPGKVQSSLKMKNPANITEANNSLFIKPEPGLFVFSNAWLPHSFTRNTSDQPCRFIHFNISLTPLTTKQENTPIVV